jgi:hypothetical protein
MWSVEGIDFTKCIFNDMGSNDDYGILCTRTGFVVTDNCRFKDLNHGIYIANPDPIGRDILIGDLTIGATKNLFDNCSNGVFFQNTYGIDIIQNDFNENRKGVYCEGANTYEIRRNGFGASLLSGIHSRNESSLFSNIECNTFIGRPGPLGIRLERSNEGLDFDDNTFIDLARVVYGISTKLPRQGTPNAPRTNDMLFYNPMSELFVIPRGGSSSRTRYWHPDRNNSNTKIELIPDCAFTSECTRRGFEDLNSPKSEPGIVCPPIGDPLETGEPDLVKLDSFSQEYTEAIDLIDNGDTDDLLSSIENFPSSIITLNAIDQGRPFLSDTILQTITLESAYTESYRIEVLGDHVPLDSGVLSTAQYALSDTGYAQVLDLQDDKDYSPMDSLTAEITWKQQRIKYIFQSLHRDHVRDRNQGTLDTLMAAYILDLPPRFDYYTALAMDQDSLADAILNALPTTDLGDTIFQKTQNWYMDWKASGYLPVDSLIIDSLKTYSGIFEHIEYVHARVLLTMWADTLFEPVEDVVEEDLKAPSGQRKAVDQFEMPSSHMAYSLKARPNPTRSDLNIEWEDWLCQTGQLTLYNYIGQVVRQSEMSGSAGTMMWTNLPSGIHWLEARCEGKREVIKVVVHAD